MDPNANLKELLAWANARAEGEADDDADRYAAELVLALDEWIAGGGFLPKRWQRWQKGKRP